MRLTTFSHSQLYIIHNQEFGHVGLGLTKAPTRPHSRNYMSRVSQCNTFIGTLCTSQLLLVVITLFEQHLQSAYAFTISPPKVCASNKEPTNSSYSQGDISLIMDAVVKRKWGKGCANVTSSIRCVWQCKSESLSMCCFVCIQPHQACAKLRAKTEK